MKPNIIIFFSDQQRHDTLGCYGQKLNVTPNIDKLAKEGVMFEYAFTPQPVCGPARACLQTGLYATQTTAFTNARSLPSNYTTLADYFNFAGYETAYFGKWHLASDEPFTEDILKRDYSTSAIPESRRGRYKYWRATDVLEFTSHGYDGYIFDNDMNRIDFTGYRTDCITDYALDYLNCYNKDAPFFMFISHIEPHQQNDHRKCEGPIGSDIKYRDYEIPKDLLGKNGNWDINYPDYLGACNSLDFNLGRIIDLLKAKKIYENTIIIYTSDHSCHFGTRNNDYKRTCHDNSIRIPLIIKGGSFCGGKVISNHIVSLLDIPPTILESAGIAIPDHYMRKPLSLLLNDTSENNWEDEVFVQISENYIGRAIRTPQYTYAVKGDGNAWIKDRAASYYNDCLYDNYKDPYQNENLIEDKHYINVKEHLKQRLIHHIQTVENYTPVIYD